MNRLLFLLLLLLLGWSSYAQGVALPLGPLQLLLPDARSEDFRLSQQGDTYTIEPIQQTPLDSAYIVATSGVEILEVEDRLIVDFLQETVDDQPAFYIDAPHEYILQTKIPMSAYRPHSLDDVQLLPEHLAKADKASRQAQHRFYTDLLARADEYMECCPEYMLQAKYFLPKTKTLPFDELNIHAHIRERTMLLRYRSAGVVGQIRLRQKELAREQ